MENPEAKRDANTSGAENNAKTENDEKHMNEIEENTTTYDTHDNASELSSLSDIPTPVPISESTNYQTP